MKSTANIPGLDIEFVINSDKILIKITYKIRVSKRLLSYIEECESKKGKTYGSMSTSVYVSILRTEDIPRIVDKLHKRLKAYKKLAEARYLINEANILLNS